MTLITLIAASEAILFSASHAKRGQTRRQQVLMGTRLDSSRRLPMLDEYLQRKTADASRVQQYIASRLAGICRHLVHTRSFEYLLLHVVRTTILKGRSNLIISQGRVSI
jgi:hypothetical protein